MRFEAKIRSHVLISRTNKGCSAVCSCEYSFAPLLSDIPYQNHIVSPLICVFRIINTASVAQSSILIHCQELREVDASLLILNQLPPPASPNLSRCSKMSPRGRCGPVSVRVKDLDLSMSSSSRRKSTSSFTCNLACCRWRLAACSTCSSTGESEDPARLPLRQLGQAPAEHKAD